MGKGQRMQWSAHVTAICRDTGRAKRRTIHDKRQGRCPQHPERPQRPGKPPIFTYRAPLLDFPAVLPRPDGDCPGIELALTCGNGQCEQQADETPSNCPIDCTVPQPLVSSYNGVTQCAGVTAVETPASVEHLQALLREQAGAGVL